MKQLGLVLLAGAMLATGVLSAKEKDDKRHNDAFVNGPANESRIAQEVRHRLVTLPYFGVFDDLGYTVNDGTVTLVGQVVMPVLKDDAARTIKGIEGVTNIVNNIEVLPLSPMDDRIRRATYRAIYGDPVLSTRYGFQAVPSIHIIVKNGNVRLEGVVANEMDRTICGVRANAVPGVFKVENDLRIEAK